MPEGPAPKPLAIGCSTTLAVAPTIMVSYCPTTSGGGTPTHAVALAKGSWSWASWGSGSATKSMAGAAACLAVALYDGVSPEIHLFMVDTPSSAGF